MKAGNDRLRQRFNQLMRMYVSDYRPRPPRQALPQTWGEGVFNVSLRPEDPIPLIRWT